MTKLVENARAFAFFAHNEIGQLRKYTGEPYTCHLEAVAETVAQVGGDEAMIAAAYLHDTVEDTPVTIEDIQQTFGEDVANLVWHLTDVSRPEDGNRKLRKEKDRAHIANGCARVHTIKLADLIDNSSSITEHDPGFASVYMREKRLLLEVLTDGDAVLFARATSIVDAWFASSESNKHTKVSKG